MFTRATGVVLDSSFRGSADVGNGEIDVDVHVNNVKSEIISTEQ